MHTSPAVDWSAIDTVLDMDGTLLDLRFDNWFWQDLIRGAQRGCGILATAGGRGDVPAGAHTIRG
jgi:hypothetical protein